jgi:uncharacterized protein HemX
MKLNKIFLILSAVFIPLTAVNAGTPTGCAAKKQNIEAQLKYAKDAGNTNQVRGLEKALAETNAHCTDANLTKQRQQKINEKERKVQKRQQELNEAKSKNDAQKIAKKQKKLAEAQTELNEAKRDLNR